MQSNNNTGMSTVEARARLIDQERQQQQDCNCEQHAEARAWLTDQERQQQPDRNYK
jgi:hypothetical protein